MEKRAAVLRAQFPAGRRVLAISDIHGNLPFLKGLLQTARVTGDDILVLVGDLIEKGPDSLGTLRFLMELSKRQTVYALSGNCDSLVAEFAHGAQLPQSFYHHYLGVWGERSLLLQMARAAGYAGQAPHDLAEMRRRLRARFPAELAWLSAMPTILVNEHYLFVHGGVPRETDLERLSAWHCMKNDDFLNQGHRFSRWCVVGHWPVTLYNPDVPSAAPLLDGESRIASIDGGCVLKLDGQLNALILPEEPGGAFSWAAYDGLPKAAALDAQAPSERSINIRWGHNRVELLSHGGEFSRCRHLETGWELDILNSYLYEEDGMLKCEDSTDYRLPVEPGDVLSVVRRVRGGCLAKKEGVTGWYFGRLAE